MPLARDITDFAKKRDRTFTGLRVRTFTKQILSCSDIINERREIEILSYK